MRVDEFDFDLPPAQIAQHPPELRGDSRLMVLDRAAGSWRHERFCGLATHLRAGDVLVRNDTRVLRARLRGKRAGGGDVEVLLLEHEATDEGIEIWTCLAKPGRRLRLDDTADLGGGIVARWIDDPSEEGIRRVALRGARPITELLERFGELPLPPYIQRPPGESDADRYQTVFATNAGAVAAPTAGLHFTNVMLAGLRTRGVDVVSLTLHVGPATFLPVRVSRVEDHRLGSERVEIPAETAATVTAARRQGRRVIAIGTTTVRALEGAADELERGGHSGRVSIFIVPGHRFRVVDGMITNFHLPRSTLLMMIAAFAGTELVRAAYRDAVKQGYRFYSYGDAMLIL